MKTNRRSKFKTIKDQFVAAYHSHAKTFSRANITAFAATVVDFGVLAALVELAHVHYVPATSCGAVAGAITNFLLNKYWAFEHKHGRLYAQGARYAIVSFGSLLLNTFFVFCLTEFAGLMYLKSKTIAAIAVGWGWNYPLHRYFVFPPVKASKH